MNKVKNQNYITIQGFMINELQLKGNELLVYAIIYGFSQTECQKFTGGLQYLSEWTNSTKQGVLKNLKSLMDKKLIKKEENIVSGIKLCSYYVTEFNGIKQSLTGCSTEFNGGIKQSLPNNINNNINNKKEIYKEKFQKPTLEEVCDYCKSRKNNIDPESFIDFYESKGWYVGKNKMKDWKAAIRTWERNHNSNITQIKTESRYADVSEILTEEQLNRYKNIK